MMRGLFCLFLCLSFVTVAKAQVDGLKPLPDIESLDLQTFVSQSNELNKTFENDPYLAFEVQLPQSFNEKDFDTLKTNIQNDRLYGEVFRANGKIVDDVYPYFSVRSYDLNRMISAKNWLVTRILDLGQTLRSLDVSDGGDQFEAIYVRFDELGNTEVVRAKGYMVGPRIILAEYAVPVSLWGGQRDYQTYAIKSFELAGMDDPQMAEDVQTYAHLNSFSMAYPASWYLKGDVKNDTNRIDLLFTTADDLRVIFADIDVSVVSTRSLADMADGAVYPTRIPSIINARKQAIIDDGFVIGEVMEKHDFDLNVETRFQVTEVYPLRKKLTDYVTHRQAPISHEFWVTVIKEPEESGKSYIVTMVVPSRNDNLRNWAMAVEGYKFMIESFR